MPKVSVLMPVYKSDEIFLKQAINSILQQTYQNFELIILNDWPADKNRIQKIVKSFNDSKITFISNEKNLGISKSRNKLINLSSGEYIAVMDHDDISLPERFEQEVAILNQYPNIGVVGSRYKIIGEDVQIYRPQYSDEIKYSLKHYCCIAHPSTMIRKSVLESNNITYNHNMFPIEDYDLWLQLINCTDFYNIPNCLLLYRMHDKNTLKLNKELKLKILHEISLKTKNIKINNNFHLKCKTKIYYYFHSLMYFVKSRLKRFLRKK